MGDNTIDMTSENLLVWAHGVSSRGHSPCASPRAHPRAHGTARTDAQDRLGQDRPPDGQGYPRVGSPEWADQSDAETRPGHDRAGGHHPNRVRAILGVLRIAGLFAHPRLFYWYESGISMAFWRVGVCCVVLCCVVLCCVVLCCVVLCCAVLCCAVACRVVLCCVVLCCVVLCCVVLCCVVLCCVVLCCVVLCCVVLCCAEGASTRRQWPGCLPTGTGKREAVCLARTSCVSVWLSADRGGNRGNLDVTHQAKAIIPEVPAVLPLSPPTGAGAALATPTPLCCSGPSRLSATWLAPWRGRTRL